MGKVLKKYKPQIQDAVVHLKDVVIACGKDIVIQVKDGIVKIITDGATAMSDDSDASEFYFEGDYVMLIFNNDDSEIVYGFKDAWAKVKDAFKKLGDKIKATSEDLWKKIVPVAGPVIEKYKDLIIKALEKDGKVVIDEGKKIVITVINDVVKVIIDGLEAASGKIGLDSNEERINGVTVYVNANSAAGDKIKEVWEKVKAAFQALGEKIAGLGHKISEKTAPIRAKIAEIAKKYGGKIVAVLQAIVDKYKDVIMDAVEKSGRVVIEEGKKIIIEVVKDTVKVIVDGIHALGGKYEITATSADESEENGLKEIWEQVKAAVEGYVGAYKEELKKLVTKYKPRIIAELKRAKKVVIDEGKQLVIDMLGDAIKK